MIITVMRREILENVLSLRFMLLLILIVLLFMFSALFFVTDYKAAENDYWKYTNNNLSALSDSSSSLLELTFYKQKIWRKPSVFSLFSEGHEKALPNKYEFNIFEMEYPSVSNRISFLSSYFSNLDYSFIVSVILSLVALFLTYDSVCGERESGTLRLILSGSISRSQILLGKYLGTMMTILIPVILGVLINLIIVVIGNIVNIGLDVLLRILMDVLISCVYISLFIWLGLLVSSIMNRSASSMVVLLIIWVIFVILIPSLGVAISNIFYKIPTQAEIKRRADESFATIWDQAMTGKFGENAIAINPNRNAGWVNPESYTKHWHTQERAQEQIFQGYNQQMISQAYFARKILSFSPTVLYQKIVESLNGTGIDRSVNMYKQVSEYRRNLREYIYSKDQEDSDSFHEFYLYKKVAVWWKSISLKPVDFNAVPKFQYQAFSIFESMKHVVWDIGLLLLFNIILFVFSFVALLKYDVR